jgi:putative membrane protein
MSHSRTRWTAAAAAIVVAATPATVASARDGHDGHGERTKQAAPAQAPVPVDAQTFVAMATMSNTFEIRSSQIALRRSRDNDVRSIARHLIADHTAAQANLAALAGSLGLQVPPPSLDAEQQAVVDRLRKRRGNAFNRAYLKAQVVAHEKAIALFIGTGQNEANPEAIRDLTVATLPILGRHLGEVTAALDDRRHRGQHR